MSQLYMYPCNFSNLRMCNSASRLPISLKFIVRLCIGTTELCNCIYLQVYKPGYLFLINNLTQHLNQLGIIQAQYKILSSVINET